MYDVKRFIFYHWIWIMINGRFIAIIDIRGAVGGVTGLKGGVTFWEKFPTFGRKNCEKSQIFCASGAKIFENWFIVRFFLFFWEEWWLWGLKSSIYRWNNLKYLTKCKKSLILAHSCLFQKIPIFRKSKIEKSQHPQVTPPSVAPLIRTIVVGYKLIQRVSYHLVLL